MIAFSSDQQRTDVIIGTGVATGVGAVLLGTGIGLAVTSKQNTNEISPAAIATLSLGSILTLGGGISLTVVSLTPLTLIETKTTQPSTSTTTQPITTTTKPITLKSEGGRDAFIAQYDSYGHVKWAANMGGTLDDQGFGISADKSGNVYVTGLFNDTSFNLYDASGVGTRKITLTNTNKEFTDAFIAQYDSSGHVQWAAKMGGLIDDEGLGISAINGNVYVTGFFQDQSFNLCDASGVGSNSIALTSKGGLDGFIAQYDSSGRIQWAANMGGIYQDKGLGISAINGNVYVTGTFYTDQSFNLYDASGGGFKTLKSEGDIDAFIAQYDSSGYVKWAAKMGGIGNDGGFGISADNGNVYVTGTFYTDQSFNLYDASGGGFKTLTSEGNDDAFIAQYDSSGYVKWATKMAGISGDQGLGISADNSGNVYVTGYFRDTSFNLYDASGGGFITLTSEGYTDAFIAQYDSSGRIQWAAQMGGTGFDQAYGISAINGNVYVTGSFQGAEFKLYDASGGGFKPLTSEGDTDGFIAQYDSSGRIQWAANMGGSSYNQGLGISTDQAGNVYVTGRFDSRSFNLYDASGGGFKTLTNEGSLDGFIAQYDSSGKVQWAANMGGTLVDQGSGISTDNSGNVYVTGFFQSPSFKLYSSIIS